MQKRVNKFVIVAMLFLVAACSSGFRDTFGLRRNAPDEFKVVSNAPLSVPPEFSLRPPMPGAKRPQEADLENQAKDVLFERSGKSEVSTISKGDSSFLKKANAQDANPEIKKLINQEELDKIEAENKKSVWEKFKTFMRLGSYKSNKD